MTTFSTTGEKGKNHDAWEAVALRGPNHFDPNQKVALGPSAHVTFKSDPQMLQFTLSWYKFVSKMLRGSRNVLEIGCQEGVGARLVANEVESYTGIDFFLPYMTSATLGAQRKSRARVFWLMISLTVLFWGNSIQHFVLT